MYDLFLKFLQLLESDTISSLKVDVKQKYMSRKKMIVSFSISTVKFLSYNLMEIRELELEN